LLSNSRFLVIDAPSILGLKPTGVEDLPQAFKAAGLLEALDAQCVGRIEPLEPYSPVRDKFTRLLNGNAIKAFSLQLAKSMAEIVRRDNFIIVLGGDCSIIIGTVLALRRLGRYGLFFIDGHADFYQPEASLSGEVADMDLAIISGRGPDILTNISGLKPYVRDEDIVLFGYRDAEQAASYGSQDVTDTNIHVYDLSRVNELGITNASSIATRKLLENGIVGFWIHLDADVLDDSIMPAVDYRLKGGLSFSEISDLLRILYSSGQAVGMSISIFNPSLDPGGSIARKFVSSIVEGLS